MKNHLLIILLSFLCFCTVHGQMMNTNEFSKESKENTEDQLPKINREFRGVWISTVANINWPSKNNLTKGAWNYMFG